MRWLKDTSARNYAVSLFLMVRERKCFCILSPANKADGMCHMVVMTAVVTKSCDMSTRFKLDLGRL